MSFYPLKKKGHAHVQAYHSPSFLVSLFLGHSRPGLFKDLKTMGSISLFIFFITLLVLARQVGPNIIIR